MIFLAGINQSPELLQRKETLRCQCVNELCMDLLMRPNALFKYLWTNLYAVLQQKLTFNNIVYQGICFCVLFEKQSLFKWCRIYAFKLFCHYLLKTTMIIAFILILIDYLISWLRYMVLVDNSNMNTDKA